MQKCAKLDLRYVRFEYILYVFFILEYIKNLLNLVTRNRCVTTVRGETRSWETRVSERRKFSLRFYYSTPRISRSPVSIKITEVVQMSLTLN